jgi:hypothetical protein
VTQGPCGDSCFARWYNLPLSALGIRLSNTETFIQAAGAWFLHSGIQTDSGGVARYYRSDAGKYARVSNEITGYTVSILLFLYERTSETPYLEAALRAARFLTRSAWDSRLGTFPFEHASNGDGGSALAYFFDCGIIVRALLSAWRISNEPEFRDAGIAGGRSMLSDFRARDAIHPILALPEKRPLPYEPRWSASPGCYQLKSALAWRELFEGTGDTTFLHAYESVVQRALETEEKFLPGETNLEKIMDRLHPYIYFLEGLVPLLDRSDCTAVFQKGLDRVSKYLTEIAPLFVRSDVCAQLLRARLYGESIAGIPLDVCAAEREASQASSFQAASDDPRLAGGFWFGRKANQPLPFVNPVSTAFCLQALALWEDRRNSSFEARRQPLI